VAKLSEIKGAAREMKGRAVLSWQLPHLKSISDFRIVIAIAIPIKNSSGKIADRFSC
jgi:hypothetical protein